jgi:hypothetical protein
MEMSGQFQALTTLPWERAPPYPLNWKVGLDRLESNYKLHTVFLL